MNKTTHSKRAIVQINDYKQFKTYVVASIISKALYDIQEVICFELRVIYTTCNKYCVSKISVQSSILKLAKNERQQQSFLF